MATLAAMITDLCERAGLASSQIDVSLVGGNAAQPAPSPGGYIIERPAQASHALQEIMKAFFIDACESGGTLRFVPRASPGIVQWQSFSSVDPATAVLTFPNPTTAGNYLLAIFECQYEAVVPTISDTAGNAWTSIYSADAVAAWYAVANGGPDTVTFLPNYYHVEAFIVEVATGTMQFAAANGTGAVASATVAGVTVSTTLTPSSAWLAVLFVFGATKTPLFALALIAVLPGAGPWQTTPTGWTGIGATDYASLSTLQPFFTIPESDLGLLTDHAELTEQLAQEQDLPEMVTVLYNDVALNYQQGKQLKTRNPRIVTVGTKNQVVLSLPFTLTNQQARQIAESTLYSAWQNRTSYAINLWKAFYALLDPADLIQFVYEGNTLTARLLSNHIGQSGGVGLEGVSEDFRNYISAAAGAGNTDFTSPALRTLAATLLWLLDLPLLRDSDANPGGSGFYFAMSSASADWLGGVLYQSSDDANFTQINADRDAAAFGYTTTALAAPRSPWDWDTVNALTVIMKAGALAGDTDLNVLNGSNALIVGREVIQFGNAINNGGGSYTISRLLRGRRGTEWACGTHATGETVIAPLDGGVGRQTQPLGNIGQLRYYRGVTVGQNITTVADTDLTLAGNDLMPYAPLGIGGWLDSGGNLIITWVRRTRIGGDWLENIGTVPLSEDSELYDVDILKSGSVIRTISSLSTPTALYLASQISADFGVLPSGGITVNVYQRSAQVGRGFAGTGIAPTPGAWPVPWPEDLPSSPGLYYVNGT